MARSLKLEVANFTCLFGEDQKLLDFLDAIVFPAFLNPEWRRKYGKTTYMFYESQLTVLDEDDPSSLAIVGRLVKDTKLQSEQRLDSTGRLVPDDTQIPTAPSSFFVLILKNHKLLYVREQADSPGLSEFRSTTQSALTAAHLAFVNGLYSTIRDGGVSVTKKALKLKIPLPVLTIIPIGSMSSVAAFMEKYHIISRLTFSLVPTNDELDNSKLFIDARAKGELLQSEASKLEYTNPKGLDRNEATATVVDASDGNIALTVVGKDRHGDDLKGTNDQFSVKVPVGDKLPEDVHRASDVVKQRWKMLCREKVIEPKEASTEAIQQVAEAFDRWQKRNRQQ